MEKNKRELKTYFSLISLGLIGVLFVLFPVFFLSSTTDAFILPKELLLISVTTLAFLFFLIKTLMGTKLVLRTSPLNLPIALFTIVVLLSAVFSQNRYDALIAAVPVLFLGLLYFVTINVVRNEKQLLFLLSALTLGTVLSALITVLSFMKLYIFPMQYTHVNSFTTFGSLLDQAIYLALVLPIAGYFGYSYINAPKKNAPDSLAAASEGPTQKKSNKNSLLGFGIAFFVIAIGLGLSVYMLMTSQKPLILPFDTGLQTGMAAISQSVPNIFKNLLLGSGFGTYINDFTQFKAASYNNNPNLWAFTFFRSSSLVLELLATTGLLGVAAFGFLVYRLFKQKNFFLPLVLAIIAAFILPFSFTLLALLFILIALYDIVVIHSNPGKYGDSELRFVPINKGFLQFRHTRSLEGETSRKGVYKAFPLLFTILSVLILALPLYFIIRFTLSDMIFQQSLVAASQNNATETYNKQANAISVFPYRDIYYRAFSQTNLALANALATNQSKTQNKDEKANQEIQKNILTLIQQSINAGRTAVAVAPATSFNWNNLSGIYRSLIGFGENADKFTILTLNQAIALDSSNPQQYIDLGGVYYQLGKFDEAIKNFETAVNLKKDYANAYYNLGHAYEEKGQYDQAEQVYETVKKLVADNPENVKKINADIEALKKRKAGEQKAQQQNPMMQQQQQEAIDVNRSQTQLPERNPREQIPAPGVSTAPQETESPVQTPPSGTPER